MAPLAKQPLEAIATDSVMGLRDHVGEHRMHVQVLVHAHEEQPERTAMDDSRRVVTAAWSRPNELGADLLCGGAQGGAHEQALLRRGVPRGAPLDQSRLEGHALQGADQLLQGDALEERHVTGGADPLPERFSACGRRRAVRIRQQNAQSLRP